MLTTWRSPKFDYCNPCVVSEYGRVAPMYISRMKRHRASTSTDQPNTSVVLKLFENDHWPYRYVWHLDLSPRLVLRLLWSNIGLNIETTKVSHCGRVIPIPSLFIHHLPGLWSLRQGSTWAMMRESALLYSMECRAWPCFQNANFPFYRDLKRSTGLCFMSKSPGSVNMDHIRAEREGKYEPQTCGLCPSLEELKMRSRMCMPFIISCIEHLASVTIAESACLSTTTEDVEL